MYISVTLQLDKSEFCEQKGVRGNAFPEYKLRRLRRASREIGSAEFMRLAGVDMLA